MGNGRYYVEVDLSDLRRIRTSPVGYNCKHSVAVLLSYINSEFTEDDLTIRCIGSLLAYVV